MGSTRQLFDCHARALRRGGGMGGGGERAVGTTTCKLTACDFPSPSCNVQIDLGTVANETSNLKTWTYATVLALQSLPGKTPASFNGTVICALTSFLHPVPLLQQQ
jgi:hypothetical protein